MNVAGSYIDIAGLSAVSSVTLERSLVTADLCWLYTVRTFSDTDVSTVSFVCRCVRSELPAAAHTLLLFFIWMIKMCARSECFMKSNLRRTSLMFTSITARRHHDWLNLWRMAGCDQGLHHCGVYLHSRAVQDRPGLQPSSISFTGIWNVGAAPCQIRSISHVLLIMKGLMHRVKVAQGSGSSVAAFGCGP